MDGFEPELAVPVLGRARAGVAETLGARRHALLEHIRERAQRVGVDIQLFQTRKGEGYIDRNGIKDLLLSVIAVSMDGGTGLGALVAHRRGAGGRFRRFARQFGLTQQLIGAQGNQPVRNHVNARRAGVFAEGAQVEDPGDRLANPGIAALQEDGQREDHRDEVAFVAEPATEFFLQPLRWRRKCRCSFFRAAANALPGSFMIFALGGLPLDPVQENRSSCWLQRTVVAGRKKLEPGPEFVTGKIVRQRVFRLLRLLRPRCVMASARHGPGKLRRRQLRCRNPLYRLIPSLTVSRTAPPSPVWRRAAVRSPSPSCSECGRNTKSDQLRVFTVGKFRWLTEMRLDSCGRIGCGVIRAREWMCWT